MTTNLFVIANVKQLRTGGSFRILLPFCRTSWSVGFLNSAIFNSFYNRVEFGMILEGLRNFGRGLTPLPWYATASQCIMLHIWSFQASVWACRPAILNEVFCSLLQFFQANVGICCTLTWAIIDPTSFPVCPKLNRHHICLMFGRPWFGISKTSMIFSRPFS